MANSLLTVNMITREAVELFRNSNAFLMSVDRQFDREFRDSGQKIGQSLRIRLPNDYVVRSGRMLNTQDTTEQSTTLSVATQKGVDISFSSVERTMSLQDYSERVLAPAINNLCGAIAADVMSGAEGVIPNYVARVDGSNNTLSPTSNEWLDAGAILDMNSAPMGRRIVIDHPRTDARTVSSLSGLFNPSQRITEQFTTGAMRNALGYDWARDQTVLAHTAGSFSAGTVNGASQSGSTITVNAITGTLKKGDVITFAGVNAVNRVTKTSTGTLRQFVVTADVANGGTSIGVYPALTPPVGGNPVQYQTVDASPANGAAISLIQKASETNRKNIVMAPEACTFAMAELELPKGTHEAARVTDDNVSIRIVTGYRIDSDELVTRLDVIYGYVWPRGEWACVVGDAT